MTLDNYLRKMSLLGYSEKGARALIWIAAADGDLTQAPFNLVPASYETFRILKPDGRQGYFAARDEDGRPFEGTLDEAYEFVYRDRAQTRRLYFGIPDDEDE